MANEQDSVLIRDLPLEDSLDGTSNLIIEKDMSTKRTTLSRITTYIREKIEELFGSTNGIISIEHGGTGANTSAEALVNLGIPDAIQDAMMKNEWTERVPRSDAPIIDYYLAEGKGGIGARDIMDGREYVNFCIEYSYNNGVLFDTFDIPSGGAVWHYINDAHLLRRLFSKTYSLTEHEYLSIKDIRSDILLKQDLYDIRDILRIDLSKLSPYSILVIKSENATVLSGTHDISGIYRINKFNCKFLLQKMSVSQSSNNNTIHTVTNIEIDMSENLEYPTIEIIDFSSVFASDTSTSTNITSTYGKYDSISGAGNESPKITIELYR